MPTGLVNRICCCLWLLASYGACVGAGPSEDQDFYADKGFVEITGGAVSGLPGHFMLLKKGGGVCAVRFLNVRRESSDKGPSRISSGEGDTFAEYEWFYQSNAAERFSLSSAKSGKGKVHRGPSYGIGFDIIIWRSPDKRWIECGPLKVMWLYPAKLTFVLYNNGKLQEDKQLEIAPTRWRRIEEVNPRHSKLLWAKLNTELTTRPDIRIPVTDLP